MAELFTLTLGRDIEIWPEMQQLQPESSNRVTLQANTWRKRGNRNAQVAVTTWTHYCLTILQHLQLERAPLSSLNLSNVNFLHQILLFSQMILFLYMCSF